ncbi:MAG: class I SAM-dependent methyltransferase [Clostridiales bacterium]|nr:class I SAM-dependent methyltransferase [Clostridiales bacterium]
MKDKIKSFYDDMATQYDMLFQDWLETTKIQAKILDKIFISYGFNKNAKLLDCACGIGTQAIGLAMLGYKVTASDLSDGELKEAEKRAKANSVIISFKQANFCKLSYSFLDKFDIVIAMDNALPHMLSKEDLHCAIESISNQTDKGGIFVASIRDYDELLKQKPQCSTPYIHKTDKGQKVSFQTWEWFGENYKFTQYIIDDENSLSIGKFDCEYRAVKREELTQHLLSCGFTKVEWKFPEETRFYQPIVIAIK